MSLPSMLCWIEGGAALIWLGLYCERGILIVEILSRSRSGVPATCKLCLAGKLDSFNWTNAKSTWAKAKFNQTDAKFYEAGTKANAGTTREINVPPPGAFVIFQSLRYGTLYRCKICGEVWYLDGTEGMMSFVQQARVPLILKWSEQEIVLSETILAKLDAIGRTPPDIFGNGCQYSETPCGVQTILGESIDLAVVSFQQHAPFESWRESRLGSEIADVYESPYALPLDVRIATSQADELRMGFAPTTVEVPDGRQFTLNWRPNFWARSDCRASDVKLSRQPVDWANLPEGVPTPTNIAYFVADTIDCNSRCRARPENQDPGT